MWWVLATKLAAVGYRAAIRTAVGGASPPPLLRAAAGERRGPQQQLCRSLLHAGAAALGSPARAGCCTGGAGQEAFHNLHHTFLLVTPGGPAPDRLPDRPQLQVRPAAARTGRSGRPAPPRQATPAPWGLAEHQPPAEHRLLCREQFRITARDDGYEALLASVPAEFVGTKERLMPLVQLLSSRDGRRV